MLGSKGGGVTETVSNGATWTKIFLWGRVL